MPLDYRNFTLSDFSGGITDKYINAPTNKLLEGDNFLITETNSVELRSGYNVHYDAFGLSNERVNLLLEQDDRFLMYQGPNLWVQNDAKTAFNQVLKPDNPSATLEFFGDDVYTSYGKWKDFVYLVNTGERATDTLCRPFRASVYWNGADWAAAGEEAGLPVFDGSGVTFSANTGGINVGSNPSSYTNNYIYTLHYTYEYVVNGITYRDDSVVWQSPVVYTQYPIDTDVPSTTTTVNVLNIPVIPPAATGNQVHDNLVEVRIYRTLDDGSSGLLVADITNGTTSYADSTTDTTLSTSSAVYTSGGILDKYPAPKCKFITIVNNFAYYGYVEDEDSGENKPYRVIQSFAGAPSQTHPSANVEVDDEVTGLSNVNGNPIVFTKSYIYRLEGSYDNSGGGSVRKRIISENAGCVSNRAITRVDNGIVFLGDSGIYITDGYSVREIESTKTLRRRYKEWTRDSVAAERITGTFDKENNRVYWSISSSGDENDQWLVLDVRTGGLTTCSGSTFFSSTMLYMNRSIFRGDDEGYIYEHNDSEFSDHVRDISVAASSWETVEIPYELTPAALDFGDPALRKWVKDATFTIKSMTNYTFGPKSNNDDKATSKSMKEIRSFGTFLWGDDTFVWGDEDIRWRKPETESYRRRFPKGSMRCRHKQITLEPADAIIYRSDNYEAADISYQDPANPIGYNADIAVATWPYDCGSYRIAFEDDDYTNLYDIATVSDSRLTIPGTGITPSNDKKWIIVGKYKKQRFEVKSVTFNFAPMINTGNEYDSNQAGSNA